MSTVLETTHPVSSGAPAASRRMDAATLIATIAELRRQRTDTPGYWNEYAGLLRLLCRATGVLVLNDADDARIGVAGAECADGWLVQNWQASFTELRGRCDQNGFAYSPIVDQNRQQRIVVLVRGQGQGQGSTFIMLDVPERERAQLNELIMRAMLCADCPASSSTPEAAAAPSSMAALPASGEPQPTDASDGAAIAQAALLSLLDLAAQVMTQQHFRAGAMMLTNGVAAQLAATQVALGAVGNGKVSVVAVSHLDRFEHNTENVHLLESLFRAALGEDGASSYPSDAVPASGAPLADAYAALATTLGFKQQCCLPIPDAQGVTRFLLFVGYTDERETRPELQPLQVVTGFLTPWLVATHEHDKGAGWRAGKWLRGGLERFIGPGMVWRRAAVAASASVLLIALFGKWDYHVEATSQLTTDSSRLISAQFDGRIENVLVSAGDMVRSGAVMATLDTRELRQQELDARAERQRLSAEADKARAANNLAEMEIVQARLAQSEARLARVLHYLAQAQATAPFDGVVVEGERKELLAAPVKKGDRLFKVARIDGLYVEMLVPEREIRYVASDAKGVLRLVSRPDLEIPFQLATIIPMAQVKGQEGNHFLVKGTLLQAPEAWWRPGMTGMVKIEAGQQNIMWIWTHKLMDTLRMKLWGIGL